MKNKNLHELKIIQAKMFFLTWFIPFLLWVSSANAQNISILPDGGWSAIYAGEKNSYRLTVKGERGTHVYLHWCVKAKGRILSKGETDFHFNDSGKALIVLPLKTPKVKSTVKLNGALNIKAFTGKNQNISLEQTIPLTIISPEILTNKINRPLYLFDPSGETAGIFQKIRLPYTLISKNEMEQLKNPGLVVTGKAVALNRHRGIIHLLTALSKKGFDILILQPASGRFSLFDLSKDRQPSKMVFSDPTIVQSFSDGFSWIETDSKQKNKLQLQKIRGNYVIQITEDLKTGWDWFDLRYSDTGSELIVCVIPILDYIEESPVPQLILKRLIAFINESQNIKTLENK